jgi:hypothetical protein
MAAVAAGIGLAACGGSSPSGTPASAPAPTSRLSATSRSATGDRCAAQSGSDPATLIVCLARHGVRLQSDGTLRACLQTAPDATSIETCINRAVR